MMPIKAIYNIPSIKHTFFIVNPNKDFSFLSSVEASLKRRKYLDEIRIKKHNPSEIKGQKWILKALSEKDVFAVLTQEDGILLDNRSFNNPCFLELLTIRSVNHPALYLDESLNTPKILDVIPEEDVLEVFIE